MFYTKNNRARKYFVGRRLEGNNGTNIFYSVPIKRTERKASRLTIVQHGDGSKVKVELNGSEVFQLRRILRQGRRLMNQ